jgi:hypothetical protein
VAQVAALLDVTEDAVKKRLSRARATLRTALPDSVGRTLSATAPGAAFTAAVLSGLTAAAPATASASVLAASQGAAHAGIVAKLSLLLASVLPGALGGVAVVLAGTRHLTRDAFDDEERLGVRRFRLVGSLVVIVFALAFPTGSLLTGWRPWPAVNFVMFVATLAMLYGVWLPKVLRRRFEAELREDPARALARRRRARRAAIIGWTLGLTFGTLGVVLAMWLSG